MALPHEPCTHLSTPSKILSGFSNCWKEPGAELWIDIKISVLTLHPRGYRCRYLNIHVLLNHWLTLLDDLPMYSPLPPVDSLRSNIVPSTISNQPIVGLIIVKQVILTLFLMIAPPGWFCLIYFLYGPIRSACTAPHGFSYVVSLDGRHSEMVFLFFNCWHILHGLVYSSDCVTRNFQ